jgi:hypothetical protein
MLLCHDNIVFLHLWTEYVYVTTKILLFNFFLIILMLYSCMFEEWKQANSGNFYAFSFFFTSTLEKRT